MWVEQETTLKLLRGIVVRVCADTALEDDLFQEALIHLWIMEQRHPGNSLSWHLQSCAFHLRNLLRKGRSVDSGHRRGARFTPARNEEDFEEGHFGEGGSDFADPGCDVVSEVSAQDANEVLARTLSRQDRRILGHLLEGVAMRQIASKMRVSHTEIIKHRRRIAARARDLGLGRIPN